MGLVPSLGKSIFNCGAEAIQETADSFMEMLMDELIEGDSVLKEIPIVGYFVAAGRVVLSVRDRMFLKKTLKFIKEFQSSAVNETELEKRLMALERQEDWIYSEIEIIITSLERIDRMEKTKILSEIYKAYINKELSQNEFDEFCTIMERLFIKDIMQIHADFESKKEEFEQTPLGLGQITVLSETRYLEITGRLLALGLMYITANVEKGLRVGTNILKYEVSKKGEKYAEILSRIDFLEI